MGLGPVESSSVDAPAQRGHNGAVTRTLINVPLKLIPQLANALAEAAPLVCERGWTAPDKATIVAAQRLFELIPAYARAPVLQIEPDGRITLEWEAGNTGWLSLTVEGADALHHNAVIEEDEYSQREPFGDVLPPWAQTLLRRLLAVGH